MSSSTNPRNIESGEKAPFDLSLSSAITPLEKRDHYDLRVDWKQVRDRLCHIRYHRYKRKLGHVRQRHN